MIYTEKITIAALPPLRFDLSAKIYANGDGKMIANAEARQIGKVWGDWKGLAAYCLVVAT